jgi:hypothetical protein
MKLASLYRVIDALPGAKRLTIAVARHNAVVGICDCARLAQPASLTAEAVRFLDFVRRSAIGRASLIVRVYPAKDDPRKGDDGRPLSATVYGVLLGPMGSWCPVPAGETRESMSHCSCCNAVHPLEEGLAIGDLPLEVPPAGEPS